MVGGPVRASSFVDPVDAEEGGNEPEDGRQEAKGDNGLPLGAGICAFEADAIPVEDIS